MGFKLNMTDEEISNSMDEFIEKMLKREEEQTKLVKEKGEDILSRILVVIEKDGGLHDDDIAYNPEDYDVSEDEYHSMFNAMMGYAGDRLFNEVEDNPFPHQIVIYKFKDALIELFTMSGQGTVTSFSQPSRVEFDSFNISKIIDFEDFKKDIINNTN